MAEANVRYEIDQGLQEALAQADELRMTLIGLDARVLGGEHKDGGNPAPINPVEGWFAELKAKLAALNESLNYGRGVLVRLVEATSGFPEAEGPPPAGTKSPQGDYAASGSPKRLR